MNHSTFRLRSRWFHRDPERRLVLGVCAGLADYFELPLWLVRVVTVVLAWYCLVPTVIGYFIAALLMPKRPPYLGGRAGKRTFRRAYTRRY